MLMETKILNANIIAGNVHRLRLAANLTQSELAKKLNETNEVYKLWNNTEKNSKERKKTGKIKNKLINELEEEFKINKEVIREALKKDNILKILD